MNKVDHGLEGKKKIETTSKTTRVQIVSPKVFGSTVYLLQISFRKSVVQFMFIIRRIYKG